MKVALEGVGFSTENVKVVIEDERGYALRISTREALGSSPS